MFSQSRRTMLMGTMAIGLAAILSADLFAASGSGSGGSGGGEVRFEGRITAVDLVASIVTLQLQNRTTQNIKIYSTTKLERNGRRVTLAAFKVGDRGQARITNGVTTKFEATGP